MRALPRRSTSTRTQFPVEIGEQRSSSRTSWTPASQAVRSAQRETNSMGDYFAEAPPADSLTASQAEVLGELRKMLGAPNPPLAPAALRLASRSKTPGGDSHPVSGWAG